MTAGGEDEKEEVVNGEENDGGDDGQDAVHQESNNLFSQVSYLFTLL